LIAAPVRTQTKFDPRAVFVPFFSRSSSDFPSAPVRTSKRQPSGAAASIIGSTQAFFPVRVESRKEETSGTIAPLARGSGERTVRRARGHCHDRNPGLDAGGRTS
jgi:hypothetical protein